jgi:glutamate-1-semialdehyde 2,1-aminomutase
MATRSDRRSQELNRRAEQLTPGGVHSNVRLSSPRVAFDRGKGAWLFDVDGNDYVDYLLGQGPMFLGHAPEEVNHAVVDALNRGSVFGGQHALENTALELMLDTLGWADQARFGLTGTEADQLALRLARAATGRRRFLRFEGHYHGWLDNVLSKTVNGSSVVASAGQLPSHLSDSVVVPFNDPAALSQALDGHGPDIAAIILEPVMCNNGVIPPEAGFLEEVRRLADAHGSVLVFDEVITGFRVAPAGAVGRFGVTPDLATYGKAMAGGWPVSAVAGRAELMSLISPEGVNHSGTFNSYMAGMAAVTSSLTQLREPGVYERLSDHGKQVQRGLVEVAAARDVPMRVQGLPMAFHLSFGDHDPVRSYDELQRVDLGRYADFAHVLAAHGIWVAPRGVWYVSTAHGQGELDAVLERFDTALAAFQI